MAESEIARIRRQIELECEAMHRLMNDPAIVATHEIISGKFAALDRETEKLAALVGKEQASQIAGETYNKIVK